MIVLDASAAVLGLLAAGQARTVMATEDLHAPHLVDSEVTDVLRRRALRSPADDAAAGRALEVWQQLAVRRYAAAPFSGEIWSHRRNVTAYDGAYVVLAAALGCAVLTADARLARAPGLRCPVEVVTT